MPSTPERIFTDAHSPVTEGVARVLLRQAPRLRQAADLNALLVVVPTQYAGRKLREALVREATALGFTGVLTPKIVTAPALVRLLGPTGPIAPKDLARRAMAQTLVELPLEELTDLFPNPPSPRTLGAMNAAAESILKARAALGDAADTPDFAAVARHADNREPARWEALARVERHYRELLGKMGFTDAEDARARAVSAPTIPTGIKTLVLAAQPAPSPALLRMLQNTGVPLRIIIADDVAAADDFGPHGEALPERMAERVFDWGDFDARVHTPATVEETGRRIAALFPTAAPDGRVVGIILGAPELGPVAEEAVRAAGGRPNPAEGVPLDRHPHAVVLRDWCAFLRERSWESLGKLLRRPAFADGIRTVSTEEESESGRTVTQNALLLDWDKTEENLMPHETAVLRITPDEPEHIRRTRLRLEAVRRRATRFEGRPFAEAVQGFLDELGVAGVESDAVFADTVREQSRELEALAARWKTYAPDTAPDSAELLAMLLRRLKESVSHPALGAESPTMRGWLELLWEDAPHTLVLGMNDGAVPESITADPYLPGEFRRKLGLPDDESRFARDAYTLARTLARISYAGGRIGLFAPKHNAAGEPLRPSRLLFLGAGDRLPERVTRLYSESHDATPAPARTLAWRWKPRVDVKALDRIRRGLPPTAFREYLECPLRFYLKRVAGARRIDPEKPEYDAGAFGDLVHDALTEYAASPESAALSEEPAIREALMKHLAVVAKRRHGEAPSLSALIQLHAARARLGAFATIQAELRREGWSIRETETPFQLSIDPGDGIPLTIAGRLDRIDTHPDGRVRIIDYKTSDKGLAPEETHLGTLAGFDVEDFTVTHHGEASGKAKRWKDLQLPVYAEAAIANGAGTFPEVAYVILPAAASDSRLAVWSDYTRALHDDALTCLRGIVGAVRAGRFHPSPKKPAYDDFETAFGDDAAQSVDLDAFDAALSEHPFNPEAE